MEDNTEPFKMGVGQALGNRACVDSRTWNEKFGGPHSDPQASGLT
jgi:hypothetical protein